MFRKYWLMLENSMKQEVHVTCFRKNDESVACMNGVTQGWIPVTNTHCIRSFAWIIAGIRRVWIWTMKSTMVMWIFLWRVTGPWRKKERLFTMDVFKDMYHLHSKGGRRGKEKGGAKTSCPQPGPLHGSDAKVFQETTRAFFCTA